MVRSKCQVLTFAMATACVAGAAMAADKAVQAAAVNEGVGVVVTTQMGSGMRAPIYMNQNHTVNPADIVNEPNTFLAASCTCDGWDNGTFVNDASADGVGSHLGGAFPDGIQAADDVYLDPCSVWRLRSICATVLTNSNPGATTKARLEIYADCNGCPSGLPLYTLTDFVKTDVGTVYMMDPSYRLVTYCFNIATTNTGTVNDSIVLHGGVYWISIIGLTDGLGCTMQMFDSTYWGISSDTVVKGSVPRKRLGVDGTDCDNQYTFNDCCADDDATTPDNPLGYCWFPVDECCFPCRDLNFVLCADECPIWVDNGVAAGSPGAGSPAGSPSQFSPTNNAQNSRTADDFPVPNCCTLCICYLEGCVFTNCPPNIFVGRAEIYGNLCRNPSYTFGTGSVAPICSFTATKAVALGFSLSLNGKLYPAYRLEFHDTPGCCLPGGAQYWISFGVQFTFTLNERAFACANFDCERPTCLVRWNPARYLPPTPVDPIAPDTSPWSTAFSPARDISFLIGGTLTCTFPPVGPGGSTGSCAADFNKDGNASVQDLFDFLAAYFTGCQ